MHLGLGLFPSLEGSDHYPQLFNPGGIAAISRGLSAAIPPDPTVSLVFDPEGVAESTSRQSSATPFGVEIMGWGKSSGGIASLNHRLMAMTPAGVKKTVFRGSHKCG